GEFHVDNVTTFEGQSSALEPSRDEMDVDTKAQDTPDGQKPVTDPAKATDGTVDDKDTRTEIDFDFLYPVFWKLQQDFSNPLRLFTLQNFDEFRKGLELTLRTFKDVPKVIQAKPGEHKRGVKRKHREGVDGFASNYNPKYLTSRDLFKLEVCTMHT